MTSTDYGKSTDGYRPLTTSLEPVTADLGTPVTPTERFFVCSAGPAPIIAAEDWALSIDGDAVSAPVTVGLADLAALPNHDVTAWLECAGNGRALYGLIDGHHIPPENARTMWTLGGMGLARWRGPRLVDVLGLAALDETAAFVSPVGLDHDNIEGEPARMCLPLAKALEPSTIVATHMNGEPLTVAHGAPARVIVPGWVGAYSVKWLGRLTVSSDWLPSWRTEYYVHRTPEDVVTGPLTAHPPKSSLALPYPAQLTPGRHHLSGYARSGRGTIVSVEWSLDGGDWTKADLDPPVSPEAWTVFRFDVDLTPGSHEVRTKAADGNGVQPAHQPFHPYGMLWHAVIPHQITVPQPKPG